MAETAAPTFISEWGTLLGVAIGAVLAALSQALTGYIQYRRELRRERRQARRAACTDFLRELNNYKVALMSSANIIRSGSATPDVVQQFGLAAQGFGTAVANMQIDGSDALVSIVKEIHELIDKNLGNVLKDPKSSVTAGLAPLEARLIYEIREYLQVRDRE